jgi:acyl-CoA dehydrogenase
MTDERALLRQTAAEMIAAHCAPHDMALDVTWQPALWADLEETGFSSIGIAEEHGGAGGDLASAADVLRELSKATAAVPFAESALLAGPLIAAAGIPLPPGPLALATVSAADELEVAAVPWAELASALVVVLPGEHRSQIAVVESGGWRVRPGRNLADEPRDDVALAGAPSEWHEIALGRGDLGRRRALVRAIAISGALEGALESSVRYAREREQFGRPISAFQSIQEMLAALAGETLSVRAAVEAAVSLHDGPSGAYAVAAAKTRAGEAAGLACQLAHQIHGAIGFTDEHILGRITRRLWAWRDEDGNEREWARRLGELAQVDDAALWPVVVAATAG